MILSKKRMKKNTVNKVTSIAELIKLSQSDDGCECYIRLNYGCKSSKIIRWQNNRFHIIHEVDDSESFETPDQLKATLIGEAIKKGALILYESH